MFNFCSETVIAYSLRISLSTVLLPAPIPPPIKSRTGLLSLWATGAITSVHWESSFTAIPIAFISSTNVLKTLATFRFLATLSNLCSLRKEYYPPLEKKIHWSDPSEHNCKCFDNNDKCTLLVLEEVWRIEENCISITLAHFMFSIYTKDWATVCLLFMILGFNLINTSYSLMLGALF